MQNENGYVDLPITRTVNCPVLELKVNKARDLALALCDIDNCVMVACLRIEEGDSLLFQAGDEVVIFDMGVEVSQRPVNDIRYTERIAILCDQEDKIVPWTFALRKSFPKVLHRISLYFEHPTCLCIYELPYDELKLRWRPQQFLEDIRLWLALTSAGKLHQDDQPLEPFILSRDGKLILPHDIRLGDKLFISSVSAKPGELNLIASKERASDNQPFYFIFLIGDVQDHGIIDHTPRNLLELHEFLKKAKIDFFDILQTYFRSLTNEPATLQYRLLLVVQLPKKGKVSNLIETDFYAFFSHETIRDIGLALNVWSKGPTGLGLIFPYEAVNMEKIKLSGIGILAPYFHLSTESAKIFSGFESIDRTNISIAQIGLGALGSQLFMNLAKTGYGRWKLIDSDILFPHNTVRHYLTSSHVGQPKSIALAIEANKMLVQPDFAIGMWENYLHPLDGKVLDEILMEAEIVLDLSTSISLERDLSRRDNLKGHSISMFLNPSGTDLVVLSEDEKRTFRLDVLEFQYYRALIRNDRLKNHLQQTNHIRYSNSCRDITNRISQDLVALHAAIGSRKLKKLINSKEAEISIFKTNDEAEVTLIKVPVSNYKIYKRGEWEVYIDQILVQLLTNARQKKLPNETGGILIGGYDFQQKRIYLIDSILSPKDSKETPTSYVRGIVGLREVLNRIESETGGNLIYAGEWHSHPKGCSVDMSKYDIILFKEIEREMKAIGFPPLMLIFGEDERFEIYVEIG